MLNNTRKGWFIFLALAACLLLAFPAAAEGWPTEEKQDELKARINNIPFLPFPFFGANPAEDWYWEIIGISPRLTQYGQNLFLLGRYSPNHKHGSWGASYDHSLGYRGRWGIAAWDMVTFQGIYGPSPLWMNSDGAQVMVHLPLGDDFTLQSTLSRVNSIPAFYEGNLALDSGVRTELNSTLNYSPYPDTSAYLAWTHGVNWFSGQYNLDLVEAAGMKAFPLGKDRSLTLWTKASLLTGQYPREAALTLGDGRFSLDRNLGTYLLGSANNLFLKPNPSNLPYLRGYEPGAFLGDRLYVFSAEYAKTLIKNGGVKVEAVTFMDGGNAWYQEDQPGPVKLSAGVGLRAHLPLDTPTDMGLFTNRFGSMFSLDAAHGLSEEGVWKIGFTYGISYVF